MTELYKFPLHPLDEQLAAGLRGDFELGWTLAQMMEKSVPWSHRAAFNRGWYEMWQGRLLNGFRLLDRGRWEGVYGDKPLPTDKPIYHSSHSLRGKSLLLCLEGGLGDEIINARFAQDFHQRGAKVTIACDPGLKSVFARMPAVASVVGHKSAPDVYHDFWVPGMSAPHVLEYEYPKLTGEAYLTVDSSYRQKWKDYFEKTFAEDRPRVGLRFYGNPRFEHEQHRRFPKEAMLEATKGVNWVSLQKEETTLPIQSWEDTLAVIEQLDLVVTSCTSVAHASAALGKPTWVIVPILPYYIWALPGDRSPWYKSVRLFRQRKFGEWQDIFNELQTELLKWQQGQSK